MTGAPSDVAAAYLAEVESLRAAVRAEAEQSKAYLAHIDAQARQNADLAEELRQERLRHQLAEVEVADLRAEVERLAVENAQLRERAR